MTVDFGGLFVVALVWAFFKLVSKSRDASTPPRRAGERPGLGPLHDPPQEEGRALRLLLQEMERATRHPGQAGRRAVGGLSSAEKVAEPRTLEMTPRVIESLEAAPLRSERAEVDQDEEAEEVIARRAASAAARDRGRTGADRPQVVQRIRPEPADRTGVRALSPQQLRDAIVWREILGPPLSERDG